MDVPIPISQAAETRAPNNIVIFGASGDLTKRSSSPFALQPRVVQPFLGSGTFPASLEWPRRPLSDDNFFFKLLFRSRPGSNSAKDLCPTRHAACGPESLEQVLGSSFRIVRVNSTKRRPTKAGGSSRENLKRIWELVRSGMRFFIYRCNQTISQRSAERLSVGRFTRVR